MDFTELAIGTRAKKMADELREWISLDIAIEMLALYLVADELNRNFLNELQDSANKLGHLAKTENQERIKALNFAERVLNLAKSSEQRLAKVKTDLSQGGKAAADTRHAKPGGSREKKAAIRAVWASGKYSSRDTCVEQECAALDIAPSTARRALRNTPEPPSRCAA